MSATVSASLIRPRDSSLRPRLAFVLPDPEISRSDEYRGQRNWASSSVAFRQGLELSFEYGALTCSSAMRSASCFTLVITISRLRRSAVGKIK